MVSNQMNRIGIWVSGMMLLVTCWLPVADDRQDQSRDLELKPGAPVERDLAGSETHSYRVALIPGQFLQVEVEQQGIDVVVALYGPNGQPLAHSDSEIGTHGSESVSTLAEAAGEYRLEVRSQQKDAPRGRYEVKIRKLREARPEDKTLIAASQAFAEAVQLFRRGDAAPLRRSIEKFEAALPLWRALGDRVREARTLNNIGSIYDNLGERQKALDYFGQALVLRRAVGDRQGEATTLNNMGRIYDTLGEPQKALEYYDQSLVLRRAVGDRPGEATTLHNMGLIYYRLGERQKALEFFNQALPLRRAVSGRRGEANTLNSIGSVYWSLGEQQKALDAYTQALSLRRTLSDRRGEAITLNNIATVYGVLGEYQKALDYLGQSLLIRRAVGDREGEANTLYNIAILHKERGEYQQALEHHNQTLPLRRAVGDRRGEAHTLTGIGVVYEVLGERQKALDYHHQALALWRATGDRHGEAQTLYNLGANHVDHKALEYYDQALTLARAVKDPNLEAKTLTGISRVERDRGRLAEARRHIEASLTIIESLRTKVPGQDLRATFQASNQSAYETYVDLLMRLHHGQPSAGHDALALQASERARARSLIELLAESGIDIRQDLTPEQRQREDHLFNRISAIQKELLKEGLPSDRERQLKADLKTAEHDLDIFQLELRRINPRYASVQYPEPLTLDQIQRQLLDPNTALIEYMLGDNQSLAWVVTQTTLRVVSLPPRQAITEHVTAYRKALTEKASTLTLNQALARFETQSQQLYQVLFQPLESALSASRTLIIVPDGALAYVPFETLMVRDQGSGIRDQEKTIRNPIRRMPPTAIRNPKYLLERFAITYAPSASALATVKTRAKEFASASKGLIAFGDPVYDLSGQSASERASGRPQTTDREKEESLGSWVLGLGSSSRGFDFTRLPYTRAEVTGIGSLFPAAQRQVYLGAEAQEQRVKAEKLNEYRYIHFAAHGMIDEERPMRSGIVLSLTNRATDDGVLQMSEIMRLKLNADLVTLSACSTGLGKLLAGEGMIGLTRAFFYAGASSLVVSLWNVNDVATAELMKAFYQNLHRGLSKDEAL